jgi:drug/metabolite transporter (DMT)-like permease
MFFVYSLIGTGEILVLITPLLETKINSKFRQNLHLLLALLAAVAVLSYSFISDLQYGVDPLRIGYYYLVLSFLLTFLSSILRFMIRRTEKPFMITT